jgi:transcriptional regulator with XRE-family HTH domain
VSIGQAIRAAREAKGWGQVELADQVGAARETISRWETEQRPVPRRSLLALERLLGPLGKDGSKPSRKSAAKS